MDTGKCPCISKSDSDNVKSALITSREIYRHIIKTLSIDITSPEYTALEEKANRLDSLIFQLNKITCEEDIKTKKGATKQMTSEEIAKLPLKERLKIAKEIAGTVSK